MIQLQQKSDCCGCNGCTQICPKQCISMKEDTEGFLYPHIDKEICIDCHLCEKVCPVIHQGSPRTTNKVYAAKNKNEDIRLKSSSGGVFTLLAEEIIAQGGIVFGAKFNDEWEVVHGFTETKEGLADFRGSKYVQSYIGESFKEAQNFLRQGRTVLFSGTPCQIAGLKNFLRKEYNNLITVDFICHGVPSPQIWNRYLTETCEKIIVEDRKNSVIPNRFNGEVKSCIKAINFRSKILGWKKYSFFLKLKSTTLQGEKDTEGFFEPLGKNIYLKGFTRNLFLRPSCYHCPSKSFKSQSDYTIADFWGIQKYYPQFNDDKGVSALFVHRDKDIFPYEKCDIIKSSMQEVLDQNPALIKSSSPKDNRASFFRRIDKKHITPLINTYSQYSIRENVRNQIIKLLVKTHTIHYIKAILKK